MPPKKIKIDEEKIFYMTNVSGFLLVRTRAFKCKKTKIKVEKINKILRDDRREKNL